ncbi:MAG: argininosuccinate lyase [Nitrospirae bacterium]|nr:argininosuccinate lyase [Nitrospirota bacterium]
MDNPAGKKLWGGRFTQGVAKSVEAYTESISFDWRLWQFDIEGSKAHAKMLAKQQIITDSDASAILKGLDEIAGEIRAGSFVFRQELEDVHMNVESALIDRIGDPGRKLHTARSRNDQVALDVRLYVRAGIKEVQRLIREFQRTLVSVAEENVHCIMPGYTHMQRAQPVTLAHHLLAYVEMLARDYERFDDAYKRADSLPLGACALAGTTLAVDRDFVADTLGFSRMCENSMDAVSDRDFVIEFISNSSIVMMHLSRMAEEIVLWATKEFAFIEISDAYTTGSSIMPQKKNPDIAELLRGKTARVYGSLMSILTLMKALPLTYNRDMQEDKLPMFDTADTVTASLFMINEMFQAIAFDVKRMYETASGGFALATDLAEYLVNKGVPFRSAHEITGRCVRYCIENKKELHELTLEEFKTFSGVIEADVYVFVQLEKSVELKSSRGGTSPDEVARQIARLKEDLSVRLY